MMETFAEVKMKNKATREKIARDEKAKAERAAQNRRRNLRMIEQLRQGKLKPVTVRAEVR